MAVNSFREDEQMKNTQKKQIILRLFSYMNKYKLAVFGVLCCMGVTVAIKLINPLLIETAIDDHVEKNDMNGLMLIGLIAVIINVLYFILIKVRMYTMSVISNKILLDIRQELYEHIQKLSFKFFDSRPTGKILARIIGDVNSLKEVLTNAVTTLIPDFITVAGVVIIMAVKDWKLTIAALCSLPFMVAGVFFIQSTGHKRWQIHRKKTSNLNAYVHEEIAGMSVVQSFSAEDETYDVLCDLTDQNRDSFINACARSDMFGPTVDFCWGIGTMMLYLVGVKFIGAPKVSVGLLMAFGTYINMFWNPIMNLSNFYNQVVTNLSAAERIFDIMDTKPDIASEQDAVVLPPVKGEVEFKNVSFIYDKGTSSETRVLENVSFAIKPGETIALVGPTGAGKTTIVNLISRFYDIDSGKIFIDGYDLTEVSLESLRRQMGIMTQDNFIFHGTVRDNIMYGKLDASEEEMIAAAKAVNAHDFIMKLENGYDTVLKEKGAGLSIGQRQLIAFARTMISDPKILILDEATSSIDTHTEILVQKGIEALLKGRTSFVIAHRLSTIQNADRIFVINGGGIMEQGTPKELLEKKGAYYDLYMAAFAEL